MKWNVLLSNEKIGVYLLESQNNTQYCVCHDYDPKAKENQQYWGGNYFCYWNNPTLKVQMLSVAVDFFRTATESTYISRMRLEELAAKFKDRITDDAMEFNDSDEEFMEFFVDECDMEKHELDFFEIKTESEEEKMEIDYQFFYKVATYANKAWRGFFSEEEVATAAYNYLVDYQNIKSREAKLEETSICGLLENLKEDLPDPEAKMYLESLERDLMY